jgi:hypothetical protein
LLQHRRSGGCVIGQNQIGLQRDKFLCVSLNRICIVRYRPSSVDPQVAILGPPKFLESLPECGDEGLSFPVALGIAHEHANAPHALLRPRRERPRSRAAEQRDELAPLHCPVPPVLPDERNST